MRLRSGLLAALLLLAGRTVTADILYSVTDLGTLGVCCLPAQPRAINNAGQVTGQSITANFYGHAFLYANGSMSDLGSLPGPDSFSYGRGINDAGQVVGDSVGRAFLYSNG